VTSEPRAEAFTVRGGAQIGWINASWPFGMLSVSPRSLTISSPFSRSYVFEPEQVVTITVTAEDDDGTLVIESSLSSSELTVVNCTGLGADQEAGEEQ